MARQLSESTKVRRLTSEINALRRANHTLTVERSDYAKRAKQAEFDIAEWKQRCDKLIHALVVKEV